MCNNVTEMKCNNRKCTRWTGNKNDFLGKCWIFIYGSTGWIYQKSSMCSEKMHSSHEEFRENV